MLQLNNPKGAFTAAGSRLSIRQKAGPMGQLAVVRFCRDWSGWRLRGGACSFQAEVGGVGEEPLVQRHGHQVFPSAGVESVVV